MLLDIEGRAFEAVATEVTMQESGMYAIFFILISYCARCWSCVMCTALMTVGELRLSV
jgi:hypothetical protein